MSTIATPVSTTSETTSIEGPGAERPADVSTPAPRSLGSRLFAWLRWPAALAVLAYLVYRNVYLEWDQLQPVLARGVHWWAVAGAAGAYVFVLLINFYRWFLLVRTQEFEFGYLESVQLGFVGLLFNFVAPGSIGGDVVKGAMIAQRQKSRRLVAASTVFLDRCIGSLGLFIVGWVAYALLPAEYHTGLLAVVGGAFALGSIVGILGLTFALVPSITRSKWAIAAEQSARFGPFLKSILDTFRLYQQKWLVVVYCVLISFVSHTTLAAAILLASKSLSMGSAVPNYTAQVVVVSASNFGAAFIPTPGGVGALEAAIAGGFEVADRTNTDRLESTYTSNGEVPPDWKASLVAVLGHTDRPAEIAGEHDLEPAEFESALETLEDAESSTVVDALSRESTIDGTTVPAAAVFDAYRSGHGLLAYRTGLLAGLLYRVLTVLVAIVGGLFYLASRREIDAVMDEVEHPQSRDAAT